MFDLAIDNPIKAASRMALRMEGVDGVVSTIYRYSYE